MKRSDPTFDLRDFVTLLLRSRGLLSGIVVSCSLAFLATSFFVPKRYKTAGVIAVQTDYFRFPLIEEFMPSPTDPAEILSKRDSLVRSVFTKEYLADMGQKHGLIKTAPDSPARDSEIDDLFRRFEIFSLSQTTVQVGFSGPTAAISQTVVEEAMAAIVKVFREERFNKIVRARDNILAQTERMALKQDPTRAVLASRKPEVLRAELVRIEAEQASLTKRFSIKHPDVVKLEARAEALRQYLATAQAGSETPAPVLDNEMLPAGTPELYQGLVKKLAYLNIALAMESDSRSSFVNVLDPPSLPLGAIWPRKPLFLVWGFLLGLVMAGLVLLVREAGFAAPGRMRRWSSETQLPLLGELPALPLLGTSKSKSQIVPGRDAPSRGKTLE